MRSRRQAAPLVVLSVFLLSACSTPQRKDGVPQNENRAEARRLYDEIAEMDRVMFDAFNRHDLAQVRALFAPDLEFYHDTGGKLSFEQAMGGMQSNFEKNNSLRRDLVPGSLEVYPIPDYGAIEAGSHRFCHVENGKEECGTFKFVHVWQKQDGKRKITRAVSYDH